MDTLAHFYDDALKFIGFGLFLLGLVLCFVKKENAILWVLGLCYIAFLVVMVKSGWTFSHHAYYVVPFVPVMALVAGYGVSMVKKPYLRVLLLAAVALENILNQHSDFVIREDRQAIVQLEEVMDGISAPTDLIVINSGQNPTAMYFAHRKGWVAYNEQLADQLFLEDLAGRGCRFVVILKRAFGTDQKLDLDLLFDSENYAIYSLVH